LKSEGAGAGGRPLERMVLSRSGVDPYDRQAQREGDTYPTPKIWIRKVRGGNTATLTAVKSYNVYTIGVQVKDGAGKWIGLELDLANEICHRVFSAGEG